MARRGSGVGHRVSRATHALLSGTRLGRALDALLGGSSFPGGSFSLGPAYKGARVHRGNADWPTTTRSNRQELEPSLKALRARARDLSKNNPYAQSFLRELVGNVVGPMGTTVESTVRDRNGTLDERSNDIIDEAWQEFIEGPVSIDFKLDWAALLALSAETWATDGEHLLRHVHGADTPHGYAVQMIDADQMDERLSRPRGREGNEIRMCVEIDSQGRPLGYHVRRESDLAYLYDSGRDYEFIPAWNPFTRFGEALHPHWMRRPNQPRGASLFHSVIETMDSTGAYTEAALWGAKQNASSTLLLTPGEEVPDEEASKEATPVNNIELGPAMAYQIQKGYVPSFWEPRNQPLSEYPAFKKEMGREMAMGLGPQYYALAHDLESTSFSSMRGGEEQMKPLYKGMQRFLIFHVVRPMRQAWVKNAILSGRLAKLDSINPAKYMAASYRGPGRAYVNPLDEAQADALRIQCGSTSPQRIAAALGENWVKVFEEIATARKYAAELCINVDPPQGVLAEVAVAQALKKAGGGSDGNGASGKDADVPAAIRRRAEHLNGGTRS